MFYIRYAEETNYNYVSGTGKGTIGHFTQLVWRSSRKVGVGIAISGSQTWIVAKYKPKGNVMGLYLINVGFRKPGGKRGSIKFNGRDTSGVLVEGKSNFVSQLSLSLAMNG